MQDIVREAVDFLWALVLYHPTLLRVINTCSMEAPNEAPPSCTNSRDWPAILVSPGLVLNVSLNLKAQQLKIRKEQQRLIGAWSCWLGCEAMSESVYDLGCQ